MSTSNSELFAKIFQNPTNARLLAYTLHPEDTGLSAVSRCPVTIPAGDRRVVSLREGEWLIAVVESDSPSLDNTAQRLSLALADLEAAFANEFESSADVPAMAKEAVVIYSGTADDPSRALPPITVDGTEIPVRIVPLESANGILGLYREALEESAHQFAPDSPAAGYWADTRSVREQYIEDYINMRSTKYLVSMVMDMEHPGAGGDVSANA